MKSPKSLRKETDVSESGEDANRNEDINRSLTSNVNEESKPETVGRDNPGVAPATESADTNTPSQGPPVAVGLQDKSSSGNEDRSTRSSSDHIRDTESSTPDFSSTSSSTDNSSADLSHYNKGGAKRSSEPVEQSVPGLRRNKTEGSFGTISEAAHSQSPEDRLQPHSPSKRSPSLPGHLFPPKEQGSLATSKPLASPKPLKPVVEEFPPPSPYMLLEFPPPSPYMIEFPPPSPYMIEFPAASPYMPEEFPATYMPEESSSGQRGHSLVENRSIFTKLKASLSPKKSPKSKYPHISPRERKLSEGERLLSRRERISGGERLSGERLSGERRPSGERLSESSDEYPCEGAVNIFPDPQYAVWQGASRTGSLSPPYMSPSSPPQEKSFFKKFIRRLSPKKRSVKITQPMERKDSLFSSTEVGLTNYNIVV